MILLCCASELGLPEDLSAIEVILYYYYYYAIVNCINIDTFRIIQCQTYLHSASYYYYVAEHASFNEVVAVVSSHLTPSTRKYRLVRRQ